MLHRHISTIRTTEAHHLFYYTMFHQDDQTGQTQAVAQLKQVQAMSRRDSRNIISEYTSSLWNVSSRTPGNRICQQLLQ
jgi:hypothetical protein